MAEKMDKKNLGNLETPEEPEDFEDFVEEEDENTTTTSTTTSNPKTPTKTTTTNMTSTSNVKPKPKNAKKWTPEQKKKIMQMRVSIHAFRSILKANGFEEKQLKDEENILKYELTNGKIRIIIIGNLITNEIKVDFV